MRTFASKVAQLSAGELAIWRRPQPAASQPSGERREERWEGEGGSLGAPAKPDSNG